MYKIAMIALLASSTLYGVKHSKMVKFRDAIGREDVEAVKNFLKKKFPKRYPTGFVKCKIYKNMSQGFSLFHDAVATRNTEIIQLFLDHNADVDAPGPLGAGAPTALHMFCATLNGDQDKNYAVVQLLLQAGADTSKVIKECKEDTWLSDYYPEIKALILAEHALRQ